MAEKAEEKKEEAAAAPKKKLPLDKILTALFVVMNVVVAGGGAALVYMSTLGYHRTPITEESAQEELKKDKESADYQPILYTMEPLTVNLDGRPRRIIRTVISLELLDEKGFEEVVNMGAKPRDAIVQLFNSKNYSDIESIQGKLYLKDQIASILNAQMKTGIVKDVYFNEFVVQ